MKLLLIALFCSFVCMSFSETAFGIELQKSETAKVVDEGKFIVYSSGTKVGTETFHINADNSGGSADELTLGGQTVKFSSQITLDPQTMRVRHVIIEQGQDVKLVFDISGADVKLTGTKEGTGKTDLDAVVLENNIWFQYYFLVRRFDAKNGGVQQFKAFVPSIMQTFPIAVQIKGLIGPFAGGTSKLTRYELAGPGGLKLEIAVDLSGKLVYVGVPSQHAEAIREEYAISVSQLRAAVSAESAAGAAKPDYSAPPGASFTSEEVKIPVHGYSLGGTLLLPKGCGGACPVAVMITGSGQQIRDEPIPIPGLEKYRPFRQVAHALAGHGIAVLRVDDRGVGESTGADTLAASTTSSFADDTTAQVEYLRTRRDIDASRIALVGHSGGGAIAPMVAAADSHIAAIVLMAGPGEPGSEISLYQVRQALDAMANMSEEEKKGEIDEEREYIKAAQEGRDLSTYPAAGRLPWTIQWMKSDPISLIKKVRQPILVLQDALDQQITPDQATLLEKAARSAGNQDVTVQVFPGLNHLFPLANWCCRRVLLAPENRHTGGRSRCDD